MYSLRKLGQFGAGLAYPSDWAGVRRHALGPSITGKMAFVERWIERWMDSLFSHHGTKTFSFSLQQLLRVIHKSKLSLVINTYQLVFLSL